MMNKKYIWYACYGSNLNSDRFLCYIKGGKPANSTREEIGCRDKTLPIADEQMLIDLPLYFALLKKHWNNGGGCYLGLHQEKGNKTLSRKYLITEEQFIDLVRQENNDESIEIDFAKVIEKGSLSVSEGTYGNLIFLGYKDNSPIFTFTTKEEFGIYEIVKPDKLYLKTIINGLSEIYNYTLDEYIDYLLQKHGVIENYTKKTLKKELEEIM